MQERLEKARRKEAERARASGQKVKRPKFNFELVSAGPSLLETDHRLPCPLPSTGEAQDHGRGRDRCSGCPGVRLAPGPFARPPHANLTRSSSPHRLVNALQLVNREKESVTTNVRVQDCLEKAKLTRKQLIRYIQLIDQDTEGDYIGTLISTNEQVRGCLGPGEKHRVLTLEPGSADHCRCPDV